jgi:Protein of unknown function (DUF559)
LRKKCPSLRREAAVLRKKCVTRALYSLGWQARRAVGILVVVPRTPRIPQQLKTAPFSLAEARQHGLTASALKGQAWRRLGFELYCWRGLREDPSRVLAAWARMLPPTAAFAGKTAAWIHGLDFKPTDPVEVAVPVTVSVRSRQGLCVRHSDISARDMRSVRGLRTTTVHRTLGDLFAKLPASEALAALDMALYRRITDEATLLGQGSRRFRSLAELAAPAESPMETRLRWLLHQAGMPRPEVQTDLHDAAGTFLGRADLFYREARLIIEYDGGNHRERLVQDDRRQNLLLSAGFRMLRFTAADLYQRPEVVVAQVAGVLGRSYQVNSRRGCCTSS